MIWLSYIWNDYHNKISDHTGNNSREIEKKLYFSYDENSWDLFSKLLYKLKQC